jgi:hypothetical protein
MNPRMKLVRAIALEADSEDFYARAKAFGEQAAKALGPAKRAQITGWKVLLIARRR